MMAKQNRKSKIGASKANAHKSASFDMSGDKMKDMFGRFGAFSSDFDEMTRANIDAFTTSAETFGKGITEINTKAVDFMQSNIKRNFDVARTLGSAKSAEDLGSIQEITKESFQTYVEQMNEMSSLFATTLREAAEPLNTQAGIVIEKFQAST